MRTQIFTLLIISVFNYDKQSEVTSQSPKEHLLI